MALFDFLLVILSPLVMYVVHAIVCRLPFTAKQSRIKVAALSSLGTALAISFGVASSLQSLLFSLVVTLALAQVYFHVFNMSESARRIQILLQIRAGKDPLQEKKQNYSPEDLVRIRLDRMFQMGTIEEKNGNLFPRRGLLFYAALFIKQYERLLFPQRFRAEDQSLRL